MQVQSINYLYPNKINSGYNIRAHKGMFTTNQCVAPREILPSYNCVLSFCGITHGGDKLKKLVRYGIPDMYTGQMLLDSKTLEYLQYKNIFEKPLKDVILYMQPHENTLIASGKQFYELLKETAKTKPDITISDAIKLYRPEHEKKLVNDQRGIFCKLIYKGVELPPDLYKDFSVLTNITTKRLLKDKVTLPFSESEFKYKLKRIEETVKSRNNKDEIIAMKTIEKMAQNCFKTPVTPTGHVYLEHISLKDRKKNPGIVKATLRKKLEHQMKPEVLKRNSENLEKIRQYFENSALKGDSELTKLFNDTNAKIHGYPFYAKFERKSFLYELKKITKQLKNRDLAHELMNKAVELPTSYENLSAFIVKYSNDTSSKIGYYMMKDSLISIDHIVPKKNGGHNTIRNFGLSSAGVNREKSNIPFADFVRKHPETYENCQKHVDRLIELCNEGIFDKLEIPRSYIKEFAAHIFNLSPKEKKLVLDISKLKNQ